METWASPVTAERVYVHLHDKADDRGRVVTTSRAVAAAMDELSYTTVQRAIARLAGTGALKVVRATGCHPSVYSLLREPDHELAELYDVRPTTAA